MTESTVIGNREVPRSPAAEGNVITRGNAKLLHKMAYDQAEELFKAKMQDMKDHRDYVSSLEAQVLALQSKLDEALTENKFVKEKADLYYRDCGIFLEEIERLKFGIGMAEDIAADLQAKLDEIERNPKESKLMDALTKTECRIYAKLEKGELVKHEDLVGEGLGFNNPLFINSTFDRRSAVHINNINKKLKLLGMPQHIKNIWGEGYILVHESKVL